MKVNLITPQQPQLEQPLSYIPLGLSYLGAALEQGGHTVVINNMNKDKSLNKADIHGIQCVSATYNEVKAISDELSMKEETHIIGGIHPTIYPEQVVKETYADAVVTNEAEKKICDIIQSRLIGQIIEGDIILDLDSIPFPARHLFDNVVDYSGIHGQEKGDGATTVMTSRGCPYNCRFCTRIPVTQTYREHSPEYTIGELDQITDNYDVNHIRFVDDEFTLNKTRIIKLCTLIEEHHSDLSWICITRADTINNVLLHRMKKAGCKEIHIGVESGSQRVLDAMNKQITVRQLENGIHKIKAAGIQVKTYLMANYPGETKEDRNRTVKFIKKTKPDKVTVSHFTPLPGSEQWTDGDTPWFYRDDNTEFQDFKRRVYRQLK